ncbi:MAG: plasmid stabilization protein [Proteobacteria bacterium]|nr:plasmid stabilization protein [Pseudomonadota bacterium]
MRFSRRLIVTRVATATAAVLLGTLKSASPFATEASPTEHLIEIQRFKFVPDILSVRPGDTVTWINRDIAPHTATAADKSWDTGDIKKGDRKSVLVTNGFTAAYFCRFHPVMRATLPFKR